MTARYTASSLEDLDGTLTPARLCTTGQGTVFSPAGGTVPALQAARSSRTDCVPKMVRNYNTGVSTNETVFTRHDVADSVPPGATTIICHAFANGVAGAELYYRPTDSAGPATNFYPGINNHAAGIIATQVAGKSCGWEISVSLSPSGKFETRLLTPGLVNFGLYIKAWEGGQGFTLGAPEVLVPGDEETYVGFPNSWTMPQSGTRLVTFYVGPDHGSGGEVRLIRNEGSPTVLFDADDLGGQPAIDSFPMHNPAAPAQAVIIIVRADVSIYYSLSNDDGLTWSPPAPMPAIDANGQTATSGPMQPYFFFLSKDGSNILSNWYGQANGHDGTSSCLIEMPNPTTRKVRSWINYGSVFSGNECCSVPLEDGTRLVSVIRNATQLSNCATCVSTNEGHTWTTPQLQTTPIHGHKPGIPLGNGNFALPGRNVPPGGVGLYGLSCFLFDRDGEQIHRSTHLCLGSASESAYACISILPDGSAVAYHYTNCPTTNNGNPALVWSTFGLKP